MSVLDLTQAVGLWLGGQQAAAMWSGGQKIWTAPAAIPAVDGAWLIYVARDIDLASGSWKARATGGAPALVMDAYGSPTIVTDQDWAPDVPVLSCQGGCFYADRTPFPSDFGFSFAAVWNGGNVQTVGYNGPIVYDSTSASSLRLEGVTISSIPRVSVRRGNGGNGTNRQWQSGDVTGSLRQWDRPQGAAGLSDFHIFENGSENTDVIVAGTGQTASDGPRLILGGLATSDAAVLTASGALRILMAALKVDGSPGTASDRAALVAFANGLKSGAIQ